MDPIQLFRPDVFAALMDKVATAPDVAIIPERPSRVPGEVATPITPPTRGKVRSSAAQQAAGSRVPFAPLASRQGG